MSLAVRGVRRSWWSAPDELAALVADTLGSPVVEAWTRTGGFSTGIASSVRCANGRRAFVKAVDGREHGFAASLYEQEATVAPLLPSQLPVPDFFGALRVNGWIALLLEDVPGRVPEVPWGAGDLRVVQSAFTVLGELCEPSPVAGLPRWAGDPAQWIGWHVLTPEHLAKHTGGTALFGELLRLESQCADATEGSALVHSDLRADNLLLTADRVVVVDWAHAARGPGWLDPLIFALGAAAQGTPEPDALFRADPRARRADHEAVDSVLAMLAGRFAAVCETPGPAEVRAFQGREAVAALRWLGTRRNW